MECYEALYGCIMRHEASLGFIRLIRPGLINILQSVTRPGLANVFKGISKDLKRPFKAFRMPSKHLFKASKAF